MKNYLITFLLVAGALVLGNALGYERGFHDVPVCETFETQESKAIQGCEVAAFQVVRDHRQCRHILNNAIKENQTCLQNTDVCIESLADCIKSIDELIQGIGHKDDTDYSDGPD